MSWYEVAFLQFINHDVLQVPLQNVAGMASSSVEDGLRMSYELELAKATHPNTRIRFETSCNRKWPSNSYADAEVC